MGSFIEINDLKKHFPIHEGLLKREVSRVKAVDGVSLSIERGESLGLVGESGCGKTTLGRVLMQFVDPTSGQFVFDGEEVTDETDLRRLRRRMQMVYQDPQSTLNPRRTVEQTLVEPLKIHGITGDREGRVDEMLERMDLDPRKYRTRFPHELSGGQRQRVGIARALMLDPEFLILDEPTSALDVSVQADILNLLNRLKREMNLTFLFISHDLSVVNYVSERTAVMYLGRIVERGNSDSVFSDPMHPYTEALMSSVHPIGQEKQRERIDLAGEPPSPTDPPTGCPFHPRCHRREEVGDRCMNEVPALQERRDSSERQVACHLYKEHE